MKAGGAGLGGGDSFFAAGDLNSASAVAFASFIGSAKVVEGYYFYLFGLLISLPKLYYMERKKGRKIVVCQNCSLSKFQACLLPEPSLSLIRPEPQPVFKAYLPSLKSLMPLPTVLRSSALLSSTSVNLATTFVSLCSS